AAPAPARGTDPQPDGLQLMRARRTAVAVAALWWGALLAPPAWAGEPSEQLLASIDRVLKILDNAELKQPPRAQERREAIRRSVDDILTSKSSRIAASRGTGRRARPPSA